MRLVGMFMFTLISCLLAMQAEATNCAQACGEDQHTTAATA
jgi:hypothetical protein